mgnify:CR=1 FL=1
MNKTKAALIKKFGSEAGYKAHMREIRAKVKNHKGVAFNNPEFAKQMSKKGVEARLNATNKDNPTTGAAD